LPVESEVLISTGPAVDTTLSELLLVVVLLGVVVLSGRI
jgi:hypothetical protein